MCRWLKRLRNTVLRHTPGKFLFIPFVVMKPTLMLIKVVDISLPMKKGNCKYYWKQIILPLFKILQDSEAQVKGYFLEIWTHWNRYYTNWMKTKSIVAMKSVQICFCITKMVHFSIAKRHGKYTLYKNRRHWGKWLNRKKTPKQFAKPKFHQNVIVTV